MIVDELFTRAGDLLTVRRAYGEPQERDGITILPVATVSGGGGGGSGTDGEGSDGQGGGYGVSIKPAGVFVLQDGEVRWQPAVDVNRLVTAGAVVVVVALITRMRIQRARARAARL